MRDGGTADLSGAGARPRRRRAPAPSTYADPAERLRSLAGASSSCEVDAENGAPDGVALLRHRSARLLDALSYEGAIEAGD